MLTDLTVPLPSIDQVLTDIRFVKLTGSSVEYEMLRTDRGTTLSYPVQRERRKCRSYCGLHTLSLGASGRKHHHRRQVVTFTGLQEVKTVAEMAS